MLEAGAGAGLDKAQYKAQRTFESDSTNATLFQSRSLDWMFVLPLILILPSVGWLLLDNNVWSFDPALYGKNSVELWYTFSHQPLQWPHALLHVIDGNRPPLIAWLGEFFVPIGQALGSIDFGLTLLNVMAQYLTLALSYAIGKELGHGRILVATCTCLFIASTPLFAYHSTHFYVEPLQVLATVYTFWLALKCRQFSPLHTCGHLLLAFAVILLSKASTAMYCVIPGLVTTAIFLRSAWIGYKKNTLVQRRADFIFPILSGAFALISIAWYQYNFLNVCALVHNASYGQDALNYGRRAPFGQKFILWLEMLSNLPAVKPLNGVLIAILSVPLILQLRQVRAFCNTRPLSYSAFFLVMAAAQLLLVLAVLASNISEANRYILAAMIPLAVLTTAVLATNRHRFILIAVTLILSLQFLITQCAALGVLKIVDLRHAGLISNGQSAKDIEKAKAGGFTPKQELLKNAELSGLVQFLTPDNADETVAVGVNCNWFNANTLNFYAAKQRLKSLHTCRFLTIPDKVAGEKKAMCDFLERSKAKVFATLIPDTYPASEAPPFLNSYAKALWQSVNHDDRFHRLPFPSQTGIAIFSVRFSGTDSHSDSCVATPLPASKTSD